MTRREGIGHYKMKEQQTQRKELKEIQFYCRIRHSKEHIQSSVNVCWIDIKLDIRLDRQVEDQSYMAFNDKLRNPASILLRMGTTEGWGR